MAVVDEMADDDGASYHPGRLTIRANVTAQSLLNFWFEWLATGDLDLNYKRKQIVNMAMFYHQLGAKTVSLPVQSLTRGIAKLLAVLCAMQSLADDHEVLVLDFANEENLSAYEWLHKSDFELEKDAEDSDKIEFYRADGALHIRTREPAFGMAVRSMNVYGTTILRLYWGVSDYPEGVSYQHGIDNEAIMVYVFFGQERLPSGEIFVPDSPYFIGLYLCPQGTDALEQPYKGHHYEKTGRYICVDHPAEGVVAVNEVDLAEEFRKSFGRDADLPVSGISIEVDTTDAENDGHAAAFLQRLEFLK